MMAAYGGIDIWMERSKLRKAQVNLSRVKEVTSLTASLDAVETTPSAASWADSTATAGAKLLKLLQRLVVHPQSRFRTGWAIFGMILMTYDLVTCPLQAFKDLDDTFFQVMDLSTQIYWTLDIGCHFLTAVYINAELDFRLKKIALQYAKSWFSFDILIVVSVWIDIFVSQVGGDSGIIQYARVLRFLRLARLAKAEGMLADALASVNSPAIVLTLGMVKLMVLMSLISHLNACVWYYVGQDERLGWSRIVRDRSIFYKYLASMHWALTQFQGTSELVPGTTLGERLYAVVTVLVSMLILATFVSGLTNLMMQLENLQASRKHQQRTVRSYLSSHRISSNLSVRIRRYVDWQQTILHAANMNEEEVLKILPSSLLMDLQDEVRAPVFVAHEFFKTFKLIYPRLTRRLAYHALTQLLPPPDEIIFTLQETATRMLFTNSGELLYTAMVRRPDQSVEVLERLDVAGGAYLSEQALWMRWMHKGELLVIHFASLLIMGAAEFIQLVVTHPTAHCSCSLYAKRFLAGIEYDGWRCHDIVSPSSLIPNTARERGVSVLYNVGNAFAAFATADFRKEHLQERMQRIQGMRGSPTE